MIMVTMTYLCLYTLKNTPHYQLSPPFSHSHSLSHSLFHQTEPVEWLSHSHVHAHLPQGYYCDCDFDPHIPQGFVPILIPILGGGPYIQVSVRYYCGSVKKSNYLF